MREMSLGSVLRSIRIAILRRRLRTLCREAGLENVSALLNRRIIEIMVPERRIDRELFRPRLKKRLPLWPTKAFEQTFTSRVLFGEVKLTQGELAEILSQIQSATCSGPRSSNTQ